MIFPSHYYHIFYIDSQCCQFHRMFSLLHITLNTITELMSGAEIMSGAESRKVGAPETNQPTNQPMHVFADGPLGPSALTLDNWMLLSQNG